MTAPRLILVCALFGGGAGALGALGSTDGGVDFTASDTLAGIAQDVVTACGVPLSDLGLQKPTAAAGQSVGSQPVTPISIASELSELCGISLPPTDLLLGLGELSVVADPTNSCSTGTAGANGLGAKLAFPVTADGTPSGGPPPSCPGCDATNRYTVANAFDALKVLYFGLTHDGGYDCGGSVRRSLIRSWRNLFVADCPAGDGSCPAGLTHAWRPGDLTASAGAFVAILDPPAKAGVPVGIGIVPLGGSGPSRMNPFCNSADANAQPPTASAAGSSDFQDLDPIRTACTTGDDVCEGFRGFAAGGSAFAGDLGLVLPIVLPDPSIASVSDLYPQTTCSTACTLVAPFKGNQMPAGFRCPSGSLPLLGECFMPYAGSADAPDPRCVSARTTRCIDTIGKPDGRQYNLATVVPTSQILPASARGSAPYQMLLDASHRLMTGSFYRIHSTTAAPNNLPDPAAGQTGICVQASGADQIGCLADADPCSLGFAGASAARFFPGLGSPAVPVPAPFKALTIDGIEPSAASYPLSLQLYLSQLFGSANLLGVGKALAQCAQSGVLSATLAADGFTVPPGAIRCLDVLASLSTVPASSTSH